MRRVAPWALLVCLALAAGLAAQPGTQTSEIRAIDNPGPRGVEVLFTWLREAGVDVRAQHASLTTLPSDVRTVVLVDPHARRVDAEEVAALEAFVRHGGTLLALLSRSRPQSELEAWLKVTPGPTPSWSPEPGLEDVGGATVTTTLAGGLLAGTASLRLSTERMLKATDEQMLAVTSHGAGFFRTEGLGEVWVFAGPELAEAARLELKDNAQFWRNVAARGPVLFDEFHHREAEAPPLGINLLATFGQLAFLGLLFLLVKSPRLGPARPSLTAPGRSSSEYVTAMGALLRTAGVETELVEQLRRDARVAMNERLGIGLTLPWAEAAREVERLTGVSAAVVTQMEHERDFLALSRLLARLEHEA